MAWKYRNVVLAMTPPCPTCGSEDVAAPEKASSKYRCNKDGTTYQASWDASQPVDETRAKYEEALHMIVERINDNSPAYTSSCLQAVFDIANEALGQPGGECEA